MTDPAAVAPAVASSLGVRRGAGATVVESIVAVLSDQQRLLVLDNCEHLLDGVRPLVAEIIRGCPRVAVLATSRERLAIDGEQVRPVAPLPVPGAARPPAASQSGDLVVRRPGSGGAPRPEARRESGRDRRHLPPAGWAAARARTRRGPCAVAQPRRHLRSAAQRVSICCRRPVRPSGRHSTLRAVLDWSYELLGGAHRQLFDRLSVFAGAFDLAAAEAVGAGGGIQQHQVVDLLTSLADASMITVGAERRDGPIRPARDVAALRRRASRRRPGGGGGPPCACAALPVGRRTGRPRAARTRRGSAG